MIMITMKEFKWKKEEWTALGKNGEMFFYKYLPSGMYVELPKRPYNLNKEERRILVNTINHFNYDNRK